MAARAPYASLSARSGGSPMPTPAGSRRPERRRRLGAALLILTLVASCGGGAEEPASGGARPPVLVLAIDGLEWDVLLPLLAEGRLPTLAGLMERGAFGFLETLVPTKSPRIWGTVATGKMPEEHGITDFVKPPSGPATLPVLLTSHDRKAKAWWDILGDRGLESDTIGWWSTWPAEPVAGRMVAQTNTKDRKFGPILELRDGEEQRLGLTWPAAEEKLVVELFEAHDASIDEHLEAIFGDPGELSELEQQRVDILAWSLRADLTYLELARRRAAEGDPPAVTAVYVGLTDVVAHRFWAALHPEDFPLEADSQEVRRFGHMIPAAYEYVDARMGELISLYPTDTTVLVVSDHGMSSKPLNVERYDWSAVVPPVTGHHPDGEPGILIAAGRGIRRRPAPAPLPRLAREDLESLGGVADVCPTLLALLGLPAGEDMAGRVLTGLLDPELLERGLPAPVPTHDDPAWVARRARLAELNVENVERLEQLRSLGYLGDEAEGDE